MLLIKRQSQFTAKGSVVGSADYFNGTYKDFSVLALKHLMASLFSTHLNNQNLT